MRNYLFWLTEEFHSTRSKWHAEWINNRDEIIKSGTQNQTSLRNRLTGVVRAQKKVRYSWSISFTSAYTLRNITRLRYKSTSILLYQGKLQNTGHLEEFPNRWHKSALFHSSRPDPPLSYVHQRLLHLCLLVYRCPLLQGWVVLKIQGFPLSPVHPRLLRLSVYRSQLFRGSRVHL